MGLRYPITAWLYRRRVADEDLHTHDPRPLPTTHDPRYLVTLATTVMKNCAMFEKRIAFLSFLPRRERPLLAGNNARDDLLPSKLLEVAEVFWSFTCIFKSKLLCAQSRLTKSEGRNIKLRCYRESRNSNSGTSNVSSEKNTLTVNTDDQKFNSDNVDGHSQTGNRKKKSASWIQKTSGKNKSNEKRLETLFTHCRSKHLFTQTSFYCEFGKNKAEFFAFDKFTLQNLANKSGCV